ncbi:hypothetical protein NLJ89_g7965 [Agrocybe chaxingu]|uniref:Uncharacterized protein n=1 Tax=Agrocybe chaxingu TaxID=84603 RepID=A0A9W8K3C3_9AGAR|nr:hypothetical protein NLJ89_g7965 [Agrocybe chaxingu]
MQPRPLTFNPALFLTKPPLYTRSLFSRHGYQRLLLISVEGARMKHTSPSESSPYPPIAAPNVNENESADVNTTQSASEKLFADAARSEKAEEEALARQAAILASAGGEHENWTGDERMQDAVLRMLVDKYKPLRAGRVMSAEEKMKDEGWGALNNDGTWARVALWASGH